jgi:ABC-2 type transport system permease protein
MSAIPASATPGALRNGSVLGLLAAQIRAEVLANLRQPEFLIGVVAIPVLLFAMFGLVEAGQIMQGGTDVGAMLFASMASYGVVSMAVFAFGVDVAQERGRGWLRRLRITPLPLWVYFAAKAVMAMAFTVVIFAVMLGVARVGGVEFDVTRLLRTGAVLLTGALAFSTMGYALAFWARPRTATTIGNLVFLPLSFASGFFFTLNGLPRFVQDLAPFLPTYHFGQLVWNQMAPVQDVVAFGSPAPEALWVHAAWVAGSFVLFGIAAAAGYHRDRGGG